MRSPGCMSGGPPTFRRPSLTEIVSLRPVDLVLVKGEHRAIGVLSEDERRGVEPASCAGDIRTEDTLRLIREGRRSV